MKKLINNIYANFYLNAATKFGLEYIILNKRIGLARIYNESTELDISSNVLGVNSMLASCLSENKVKTSILLQEKKIPVPEFRVFKDVASANDFAISQLKSKTAVVIKPISGSLSIGITVNPTNLRQIKKAVSEAFKGNSRIMIEEYIPGKHYRITVLDDEVIAVTERIAANITGDGIHTVEALIIQKNKLRKKRLLPPIFLRTKDFDHLNREKIELSKVYPEGVNITLQLGCDLDIGGERVRIDRTSIPQENLDLFINAAKSLSLRFSGIDYISPDIIVPFAKTQSAINEINSAPDSDVHFRDSYPHDNYAAERIIEKIFSQKIIIDKDSTRYLPNRILTETLPN